MLPKVLSLHIKIVMSTNLEYRERETQRKRESRQQASEAQREKEREIININGDIFLFKEQNENFVAVLRK